MEWCYDGLGGSVIKWTMGQGSPNDHPSILAFIVGTDGKAFSRLDDGQQYQAGGFTSWAVQQANAYEKAHPSTRMPFARGSVSVDGEGTEAEARCNEFEKARSAGKPTLTYFGRAHFDAKDKSKLGKAHKKQVKFSRKFEKGLLNSKKAASAAKGWVLLRFDLADDEHAVLARNWNVSEAPTLLLWTPGADKPVNLGRKITAGGLVVKLKAATAAKK